MMLCKLPKEVKSFLIEQGNIYSEKEGNSETYYSFPNNVYFRKVSLFSDKWMLCTEDEIPKDFKLIIR